MKPSKLFLIKNLSRRTGFGFVFMLLIVCSCAPVRPTIPAYHGSVQTFIEAASSKFDSMKSTLSVHFEKRNGRKLSADAVASITPGRVSVRFYRMGMLVGDLDTLAGRRAGYEVYEGVLKKAFMWWRIPGYQTQELPGEVMLATVNRKLILAARTYVPIRQTISLPDSDAIVTYSRYREVEGSFWYPFNIRVIYRGNSLEIKVSRVSLTHS